MLFIGLRQTLILTCYSGSAMLRYDISALLSALLPALFLSFGAIEQPAKLLQCTNTWPQRLLQGPEGL